MAFRKLTPIEQVCWYCKEPFITTSWSKRYCDKPACVEFKNDDSQWARLERARIRKEMLLADVPVETRLCDWCGKRFDLPPSDVKSRIKFCSRSCRNKANGDAASKLETVTRTGLTHRVCHDCGKPTNDYRCPKCLEKWRTKNHVTSVSDVTIYCRVGRDDS